MKQKVNASTLLLSLGIFSLLLFISQRLSAQENNDSTTLIPNNRFLVPKSISSHAVLEIFPQKKDNHSLLPNKNIQPIPHFSLKRSIYLPYSTNPSPIFKGDYSTNGVIFQFTHGALIGSGSQTSMAGIGRFNNTSLTYRHIFNDQFELQLHANAMKINMSRITGQAFSASSALLYHPSDRVTFKVFGSYDIGNSYGMSSNNYGATMSIDMSDRFGMEMGVERYYNAMSGHWETVPIMIPYYRFKKFTLGLDVGGIVYEILRDVAFDKNRGIGGPTIAPPRMHIPIR